LGDVVPDIQPNLVMNQYLLVLNL